MQKNNNHRLLLLFNVLIPIAGMIFLGWATIEIVYLYWVETIIIGLYNLPKMLLARGNRIVVFGRDMTDQIKEKSPEKSEYIDNFSLGMKIGLALFFIVHYGMFCAIQGAFIFSDLAAVPAATESSFLGSLFAPLFTALSTKGLWLSVVLLFVTNGFDFVAYFIANKEYEHQHTISLMMAPYKRVFVQQFVVILGGAFLIMINAPMVAAILLVIIRTAIDWYVESPRFQQQIDQAIEE